MLSRLVITFLSRSILTLSSFLISSVHHHGTADWGPSCWVLWIADAKKLKEQVIYCEEYL